MEDLTNIIEIIKEKEASDEINKTQSPITTNCPPAQILYKHIDLDIWCLCCGLKMQVNSENNNIFTCVNYDKCGQAGFEVDIVEDLKDKSKTKEINQKLNSEIKEQNFNNLDLVNFFSTQVLDSKQLDSFREINKAALIFAQVILKNTKPCEDQKIVINMLRELSWRCNSSIALKGKY